MSAKMSILRRRTARRGAVAVMTAVSATVLLGFTALTVDVGMLYNYKAEMQRTADSAAMAGATELLSTDRLKGLASYSGEISAARTAATTYAGLNPVLTTTPTLLSSDIVVGYLNNPGNLSEVISVPNPAKYNSVQVTVARDGTHNGVIDLWFARIWGINSTTMHAKATATYKDGVNGFKVTDTSGNAGLLPLALHINAWNALMAHTQTTGDNYNYNTSSKTVTSGTDGIYELNLYPGSGVGQLTPGNYGTVDIGSSNNSTADIARQIRYGVNKSDLAYLGGELKLGSNGTVLLNGDTGISAGIKDDLASIIGKPRTIPLFNNVTGPGNNSMFTVIGFAGIRILDVHLTGAENLKSVTIQPAFVIDKTAETGSGPGTSSFVYQPIRLTR